jgi:hypothetical protein
MKARMFALLSLIVVMAMLVPVVTPFATAAQSRPVVPVASDLYETEEPTIVPDQPQISTTPQNTPLMFIENVGQFAEGARFQVRGGDRTIWLAEDAMWVTILEQTSEEAEEPEGKAPAYLSNSTLQPRNGVNLKFSFVGANCHPRLEPFNRLDTHVSYFIGNNPAKWRTDVPVWGGVRYVDLYPGVALEVIGEEGLWAWRLVAGEGSELSTMRLRMEGAEALALDGNRCLHLSTAVGDFALPLLAVQGAMPDGQPAIFNLEREKFDVTSPFSASPSLSLSSTPPVSLSPLDNPDDLVYSTFLGGK